jgi:UDP:flavonoid glycosyltransferase YjiC (YdhE family)
VETFGAGLTLKGTVTEQGVAGALNNLLNKASFKARATAFAERYRDFDPNRAADRMVEELETLLRRPKPSTTA